MRGHSGKQLSNSLSPTCNSGTENVRDKTNFKSAFCKRICQPLAWGVVNDCSFFLLLAPQPEQPDRHSNSTHSIDPRLHVSHQPVRTVVAHHAWTRAFATTTFEFFWKEKGSPYVCCRKCTHTSNIILICKSKSINIGTSRNCVEIFNKNPCQC